MKFTVEQHQQYSRTLGQEKKKLSGDLFSTPAYKNMPDENKVAAVKAIADYANAKAKEKVLGVKPSGWIAKASAVEKYGVSLPQQIAVRAAISGAKTDADKVKAIIKGLGMTQEKAQQVYNVMDKYKFSKAEFSENQQYQMEYAEKRGLRQADYIAMHNAIIGVESSKAANGKTINGTLERNRKTALAKAGYSGSQIATFIRSLGQKQ